MYSKTSNVSVSPGSAGFETKRNAPLLASLASATSLAVSFLLGASPVLATSQQKEEAEGSASKTQAKPSAASLGYVAVQLPDMESLTKLYAAASISNQHKDLIVATIEATAKAQGSITHAQALARTLTSV